MTRVSTEKELGNALKENQNTIEIDGNLATKVIRIKATGNVAWAVAIGGIGIAVIAVLTGGAAAPAALIGAPAAVAAIGGPTIFGSAVGIAVAGGGVAILNKLRNYEINKISKDHVVLNKK